MDLSVLRDLRTGPERPFHLGMAVAEGAKAVAMMLRAITPSFVVGTEDELAALALPPSVPSQTLSKDALTELIGFKPHSAVMAVSPIPERTEADAHVRGPRLFLNSIVDNANVGAIVRTAVALGIRDIVVDAATSSPFMRRAVRTSMGMVFHATITYASDVEGFMEGCTAAGRTVCMVEQTQQAIPLSQLHTVPDVIVVGTEGRGITPQVLRHSSLHCAIPMEMDGCSLNVAAATAIVLAHVRSLRSH